jgi:hypothetical protein
MNSLHVPTERKDCPFCGSRPVVAKFNGELKCSGPINKCPLVLYEVTMMPDEWDMRPTMEPAV